jgi:hypothetical protein
MGNRIHLLHAASTIAVISIMLKIASAQTTQPTGPMFRVPNFDGMNGQQAITEFAAARNSYRKVVDTLMVQMEDLNADPFARECAAYTIGRLRADIVVSDLIRFIDLRATTTGREMHPTPWADYPLEEALERIGQRAFEDALNVCLSEDNQTKRALLCTILRQVGHPEVARLRLAEKLNKTGDDAETRRIRACLDLIDDPRQMSTTGPAMAASVFSWTQPSQTGTLAFVVPEFRGMTYEQAIAVIWSVNNAFAQVVDKLIAELGDANAAPMARACAATTLSELRAENAVPLLIKMIDFQATWPGRGGASAMWNGRYPCAAALRGIGTPAFEAALAACQTEDDPLRRSLLVPIVYGVGHVEVARLRLTELLDKSDDEGKHRIQACLDLMNKSYP